MATCPDCHAFLDEGHRCDGGQRRRRHRAMLIAATGLGSGVLAFVLPKEPSALWIFSAGVIGAMAAKALWWK